VSTRRRWTCPECKTLNAPGRVRTCSTCGKVTKPKRRVTRHAQTLRDEPYAVYVQLAAAIHGVTDESCNVCGKPRPESRRWDRDHDHVTGKARGIVCGGNNGCNVLMAKWITAPVALAIAESKRAAGEPDAERWALIAGYLGRVATYYASVAA
jgi:recombination endonuclease VII